ncbi:RNA-guided endonuclease TnpB family protein [Actinoallomurus sp. NPDC052274]|uniref:RNA-guided endonuclease InsQ/TnpB family protein n=1 Tax=Actinoallomurus sp. NPDC052274 TaxID=3155420 RepID=UPI0034453ECD
MRFRLAPTPAQEQALLDHCSHARYVWNLAVEQHQHWRPGRASAPGYAEQSRQLTEARESFDWLAAGSQTVPGLHKTEANRLRRLQRRLARAKPGSNRRARVKTAIGRIKARETDRRKDWVEQTSTALSRRYDLIRVEDLKIKNIVRSARGTLDAPGTNVRAKAGLNRSIHAAGWGLLVTRLEQKAPGRVEKVDPAYTSQICHACGHCAAESRESQAVFRCRACGHADHADVNAAKNIRDIAVGRTVTCLPRPTDPDRPPGRGALQPLGGAMNGEPQPVPSLR